MFDGFEWDEAKRETNIAKHGFDFVMADEMFDGRPLLTFRSRYVGEERHVSIARVNGMFLAIVYAVQGRFIRIISLRRARDGEKRKHQEIYGR